MLTRRHLELVMFYHSTISNCHRCRLRASLWHWLSMGRYCCTRRNLGRACSVEICWIFLHFRWLTMSVMLRIVNTHFHYKCNNFQFHRHRNYWSENAKSREDTIADVKILQLMTLCGGYAMHVNHEIIDRPTQNQRDSVDLIVALVWNSVKLW